MINEKVQPDEWNEIESLVSRVQGKMQPDMDAVRKLGEFFSLYVHQFDIRCGKCINHLIQYWSAQCQKRKQLNT